MAKLTIQISTSGVIGGLYHRVRARKHAVAYQTMQNKIRLIELAYKLSSHNKERKERNLVKLRARAAKSKARHEYHMAKIAESKKG